jgi:hypothetical protein
MTIVAGGDSFVWGIDLADLTLKGSNSTWPALLAQQYSQQYKCIAKPGCSNDSIVREVIKQCEKTENPIVLVQWTFPWRFGFKYADPIGWQTIDLYVTGKQSPDITEFANQFNRLIGTTEYWAVYSTLKEIVFLQQYLKSNNIPYLFTAVDNTIFHNRTVSDQTDSYVRSLYNQIDHSNWYWFPKSKGFYQWAVENKYNVGPTAHPLEQAHIDAAELIKDKFHEMVTQSI